MKGSTSDVSSLGQEPSKLRQSLGRHRSLWRRLFGNVNPESFQKTRQHLFLGTNKGGGGQGETIHHFHAETSHPPVERKFLWTASRISGWVTSVRFSWAFTCSSETVPNDQPTDLTCLSKTARPWRSTFSPEMPAKCILPCVLSGGWGAAQALTC